MNIGQYLEKIKQEVALIECISIARNPNEWFESILLIIENIQTLTTFLGQLDNKDEYLESIFKLNSILKEVVEAMENTDYVLVGDIICYELNDILDTLK